MRRYRAGKWRNRRDIMNHGPKKPVDTTSFWRERILKTIATGGMLHQIILDDSYDLWNYIQGEYAGLLRRHIKRGQSVLDAGCGYGALCCCFDMIKLDVDYHGVDFSPDLIELANYRYGPEWKGKRPSKRQFLCADARQLSFEDKSFDWCVARSFHWMIRTNCGDEAWIPIHKELRRVSKNLFLGDYPEHSNDPVLFEIEECE